MADQTPAKKTAGTTPPATPEQTPPPTETPTPPAISLDDLKQAVREVLGADLKDAIRGVFEEMALEHQLDEEDAATGQVDVELERRTIRHNMFAYDLPGGGNAIGMRGQTVPLMPHDVDRGERFGAFTALPGHLPEPQGSILPAYPVDGDSAAAEQDAWVKAGTIDEIMAAVDAQPEIVASLIEAETRRGPAARKSLLAALATLEARAV